MGVRGAWLAGCLSSWIVNFRGSWDGWDCLSEILRFRSVYKGRLRRNPGIWAAFRWGLRYPIPAAWLAAQRGLVFREWSGAKLLGLSARGSGVSGAA